MESSSLTTQSVGNAIDDLVYGYDKLMSTLPVLAGKVSEMHSGTESLARNLEDKIRNLISGYEYLDSVAVQMPEAFVDSASMHRKALLEAGQVMGTNDEVGKENVDSQIRQLESLKAEMKSLSQERIVVDVLSRHTISRARQGGKGGGASTPSTFSTSSNLRGLSRIAAKGAPTSSHMSDRLRANATAPPAPYTGSFSMGLAPTRGAVNLDDPISLPQYTYTAPSESALTSKGESALSSKGVRDSAASKPVGLSPRLVARAVGEGSMMVPSMRQGRLPAELRDIKTSPSDINIPAPMALPRRRRRKSPKQGASDIKRIAMATASQAIALKYSETEAQLQQVRGAVETAVDRYERERSQSRRQMKSLAASIQEKLSEQYEEKDADLQGRLGKLVTDAVGRLEKVTDDRCKVMSQLAEQAREREEAALRREEKDRRRRAAEAKRQGELIKSLVKISSAPVLSVGSAPAYRVLAVSGGAAGAAAGKQSEARPMAAVEKVPVAAEGRPTSSSGTQTAAPAPLSPDAPAPLLPASTAAPASALPAPIAPPAPTVAVAATVPTKPSPAKPAARAPVKVVAAKPAQRARPAAPQHRKSAPQPAPQRRTETFAHTAVPVTAVPPAPPAPRPAPPVDSSIRLGDDEKFADASEWGTQKSIEQRALSRRREGTFQLVGDQAGLRWVLRSSYDESDPLLFTRPLHSGFAGYRSGGEGVGERSIADLTGENNWCAPSSHFADSLAASEEAGARGLITICGDALRVSGEEASAPLDASIDGTGSVFIEQGLLLQFQDGSVAPVPASAMPASRAEVPAPPSHTVDYEHRTTHVPPIMSRIARTDASNPTAAPVFRGADSVASVDEAVALQGREGREGGAMEKDLLALLQTVVASQQETLRGNQALMTALLQQSEQPVPAAPQPIGAEAPQQVQPTPSVLAAAAVPQPEAAKQSWGAVGALDTLSSSFEVRNEPAAKAASVSSSSGWVAARKELARREPQPTAADIALELASALREVSAATAAAPAVSAPAPAPAAAKAAANDGLSAEEVSAAVVRGVQEGVRQALDAMEPSEPSRPSRALLRLRGGLAPEDFDSLMARDRAQSERGVQELLQGADDEVVDFVVDDNAFLASERFVVSERDEFQRGLGLGRAKTRSRPVAIVRPLVSRLVPSAAAAQLAQIASLAELLEEEEEGSVRSSTGSDDWSLVIQAEEDH